MKRAVLLLALLVSSTASAADLVVDVTNVRSSRGHVRLSVCDEAHFGGEGCAYDGVADAREGVTRVIVHGVPAGRWAVQAFHDENDNEAFDQNFLGLPQEGFGFSNNPPLRGKPHYADSAIDVREPTTEISLRLRNSIFD
ncbi:DUF2141 domain-containing protein [Roseiterribacter gracilis]|uniref:DUF2141 domain-containing protein n=1 Tax=Roseiterribacter gracilis TaxID=2812848 RepID=A0A8S8XBF7_9PROT|nr:hypothetical protein TMPK1_15990 [Rhodospirillales bacterium TMPK1]